MAFVNWSSKHILNIKAMDEQHRQLVAKLNALHECMRAGPNESAARQALAALLQQVQRHFASEEELMRSARFPAYLQHKALHDGLLRQIVPLQQEHLDGRRRLEADMLAYLKDWLLTHTVKSDMVYAAFIHGQGSQAASAGQRGRRQVA